MEMRNVSIVRDKNLTRELKTGNQFVLHAARNFYPEAFGQAQKWTEFCKLCEKDCPCETSASKPNCKMCKYCKYCNLCSAVCDTICQPGGILDKVSAAIVGALPSHDPDEINKDIASVKEYIDRKDEL